MIILKKAYDEKGKYLGFHWIAKADLTPEFLEELRNDVSDRHGFKEYHKVLKEEGYDI